MSVVYAAYVYDAAGNTDFAEGDYIYSIDGTVVYSISTSALDAIKTILNNYKVGDTVEVVIRRANENKTISVVLREYVPANASNAQN